MEIGVGITAACIATFRPLMRCSLLSFSNSAGQASGMPWSKDPKYKNHGAPRVGKLRSEPRITIEMPIVTTAATGGRLRSGSDEETFFAVDALPEMWGRGTSQNITTTLEVGGQNKAERPSKAEIRARSGSPGRDSESTLGNEDGGKLAYPFERF